MCRSVPLVLLEFPCNIRRSGRVGEATDCGASHKVHSRPPPLAVSRRPAVLAAPADVGYRSTQMRSPLVPRAASIALAMTMLATAALGVACKDKNEPPATQGTPPPPSAASSGGSATKSA